jgi:hypothetical protein
MGYKDDELVYDISQGDFIAPRRNEESDLERRQREYMERERFNELGLQIIPLESPKKNPVPPPVVDGDYRPSAPKNKPTYH